MGEAVQGIDARANTPYSSQRSHAPKLALDFFGKALDDWRMKSTVSSKGQITLPAKVREALGLASGTPVQFELTRGGVLLRKGGRGTHPVDEGFGRLTLPKSVDALLDEMREPRPARPRPGKRGARAKTR